jgi:hypothetical protein
MQGGVLKSVFYAISPYKDIKMADSGRFKAEGGGFQRLNKIFDGGLETVLGDLQEELWREHA